MDYPDEFLEKTRTEVALQLNRGSVNVSLVKQMLRLAEKQASVDGFVEACSTFGRFDPDFLKKFYYSRPKLSSVKTEPNSGSSAEFQNTSQRSSHSQLSKYKEVKSGIKSEIKDEIKSGGQEIKDDMTTDPKELGPTKHKQIALKYEFEDEEMLDDDFRPINVKKELSGSTESKKPKLKVRKPLGKVMASTTGSTWSKVGSNSGSKDYKSGVKNAEPTAESDTTKDSLLGSLSASARQKLMEIRAERGKAADKVTLKHDPAAERMYNGIKNDAKANSKVDSKDSMKFDSYSDSYFDTYRSRDKHSYKYNQEDAQANEDDPLLDREWYTSEEFNGTAGDQESNVFLGSFDAEDTGIKAVARTRITARSAQKKRETEAWEQHQMKTSGVLSRGSGGGFDGDNDADEDSDSKVHVLVHNLTPPFLDGKQIFTRQRDPVSAVRDPQSNMAVAARKGSAIVRERRQLRERQRHAREAASMAGTALGNVLGVKDDSKEDNSDTSGDNDSKNDSAPTTGSSAFSMTKSLKEQRQFLPAFAVREQLLHVIRENQVIVVIGETGSGKTTQLTQFLYEDGYGSKGMIGCTQPRRVAAMSVAKRVSEEMECKLGDEVGYAIRFEDRTTTKTKIKYMTDGVLLRESLLDPTLEKYSCIIMDEAHERSLNTDILMGLFKNVLQRRRDLKLIITSATMNADRFSEFYGYTPQFTIPGRTFPVEVINHHSPVEDYVDAAVKQILSIHLQSGPGDILVFMTGQEDIDATCEILKEKLQILDDPEPLEILPIYSQMPQDLQAKIFEPAQKGTRKVIVATNIAETSLTVDGISYVVDSGFAKLKVYNPKIGMDTLQIVPISRANANQRSGRAGRTGKGVAYRLYTRQAEQEEMYAQTIPEIQRTNLAHTLLLLKSLGVKDLLQFDFLDPPPSDTITSSLYDLWALGALDNLGELTRMGKQMSTFPMDPSLSKLVIKSMEYGCSEEMLTIVSMLSVPSVFYRPKERQEESDAAREKFFVPESDHLTLLHVYNQWKSKNYSEGWCIKQFLHYRSLVRAREVREQLQSIVETSSSNSTNVLKSCRGDWDVIRKCICSGYFHQAAKVRGLSDYINLRTSVTMHLHPTSALYGLGYLPEYIVYHELVFTSKQFMSTVTSVDPRWLSELGAVFYSVQERSRNAEVTREDTHQRDLQMQIDADRVRYDQLRVREQEQGQKRVNSTVVRPGPKKKWRGI